MNVEKYFKSLNLELAALKDRVRDFIENRHWLTDGEWKESVLRSFLARNVPQDIQVGRGFILTQESASPQIDIILYSSESPVLFRDSDLVFIQPSAVRGVIEVKTKINMRSLRNAIQTIKPIGEMISRRHAFLAIFSYDTDIHNNRRVLQVLREEARDRRQVIDLLCLGDSRFVRYWHTSPAGGNGLYEKWHSYVLDKMAYGYFIHNVLLHLSPQYIQKNKALWFPETSKEVRKDGEIFREGALMEGLGTDKSEV
jgi:hypothetical protein